MMTRKTGEPLFNDRVQSRSSATTSLMWHTNQCHLADPAPRD